MKYIRTASWHHHDHSWHLAVADRLVSAAPDLVQTTRRTVVDTGAAESIADGVRWWSDLAAGGGEGMVVKPPANLPTEGRGRLGQPGLEVRGREYLG